MVGGFGEEKPVDKQMQSKIDSSIHLIKQRLNKDVSKVKGISYKQQVVAGMNYLVKCEIDNHKYEIKLHEPLPHTSKNIELMDVKKL